VVVFFSSRRRHTSFSRDWSSDVCSSDLQLQDMMNNLQMGQRQQQNGQGQQQSQMRQQMDQLGEMLRRQQELMNETFQLDQQRREIGRASCRERVKGSVGA